MINWWINLNFSPPSLHPLTCAHLRTSFTVMAPGFAHRAAAHLLGEVGRQRVLAAPGLGRDQEALGLLSWRLWRRRRKGFTWEWSTSTYQLRNPILKMAVSTSFGERDSESAFTHQHTDACPAPNRLCRSIWSCPVCSDSLRSDTHPA